MMTRTIPIQNVYYLLLYAWMRLDEGQLVDVSGIESTNLADLFTRVLCTGTRHLLRRGLDRGYLTKEEDTSCLRGRIDVTSSVKRLLFLKASACCRFDELSHDVLHNQILRSTLHRLSRVASLDSGLRAESLGLMRELHEIAEIRLNRLAFRQLQLHRNNRFYDFLMKVCDLVQRNLLVDEQTGAYRFREFVRDEQEMAALFESFVFNFLRLEQTAFRVSSDQIAWDAMSDDEEAMSFLPQMRTDISLRSADRTVVIDTKYYEETLQTHFGKTSVHSGHLYQICAYLRNLEKRGGADAHADGILLYPAVSQRLDLRYRVQGHVVRVCTLDLAQEWKMIRRDLLDLVSAA
jgi:5-methylcytosine-specific restriction enzyme subunit McrC